MPFLFDGGRVFCYNYFKRFRRKFVRKIFGEFRDAHFRLSAGSGHISPLGFILFEEVKNMDILKYSLIAVFAVYTLIFLGLCVKSGKFFKTILLFAASGVGCMVLVALVSPLTGVKIPFNLWTVGTSAVLGIPGVIGLLFMNLFF